LLQDAPFLSRIDGLFFRDLGDLLRANAIAAHLVTSGLTAPDVRGYTQSRKDEAAQRAGQRRPSEKTWAVVLGKLERRKAA